MDSPKHPGPDLGLEDTLPLSKPENLVEPDSSPDAQLLSRPIGPYRLIEPLGEGGMGEVWLAEQTEPVRRRVAVKLIKAGLDTRAVISRFESERQALGLMDHPAIARVLDAGTTPEGRPYFVMDYVDGARLTLFCDTEQLSIPERLELFCQICDGVQHAHQKAIIHRDLKPSNILIARVDGKPRPKIIDFGIAKAAAGQHLTGRTLPTEIGAMLGTPEYMSPEQADPAGTDVDTRTDVYSLGVILYELLTGELPFPPEELRSTSQEALRRRIREVDAPRPSTSVTRRGERASGAASARRTEVGGLARLLRGDLDAIVLKALEKDRTRRYGTVSELAADIQRHLRHVPVVARAPTTAYRVARYVRRHRVGVAIAATLALLLLAFAISTQVQATRVARERDRANAALETARREGAASKRVTDFLTGMFKVSDPGEARGNSITARELLDRASKDVETALSGDPVLQSRMMDTMGGVYASLGLYPRAAALVEQALAIRTRVLGADHPDTLRSATKLGGIYSRSARYADAERLLSDALERGRRVNGPEHPDTLGTLANLGTVAFWQGKYGRAEEIHRQVLEVRRRVLGADHPDTLISLSNVALAVSDQGRLGEAESLQRQILEARTRVLGAEHPDTLAAMNNLALVLRNLERPAEAEALLRKTVEIRTRVLGAEHPDTLGSVSNLANTLMDQHRAVEAEKLYRDTLAIEQRVLGPDHPNTFLATMGLASALTEQGQLKAAEALDRDLLKAQQRVLGPTHPQVAMTEYNLAGLAALDGRKAEGLSLLNAALEHHLPPYIASQMGEDPDLRALRGDPRFEAMVASVKKPAAR
jgi:non-specific serine/threonine protein kinase/serine/threonine-protein kinase